MESKLDTILREFQILKLKVEGLENKNSRENLRDDSRDRRMKNTDRDGEDDIIHRIKIDPSIFNNVLDSKIFRDWIADLDYYFNWYRLTKETRVQFARMRLLGSIIIYWTLVENTLGVGPP